MPTYGYHCPRCKTEFEVRRRMTDAPGADCPQCGTPSRRLFFPAGIVFKGSGFYKTDSRRATTASVNGGATATAGNSSDEATTTTREKKPAREKTPSAREKTSVREKTPSAKETVTSGESASEG